MAEREVNNAPVDLAARRMLSKGQFTLEHDVAPKGPGRDLRNAKAPVFEQYLGHDRGDGLSMPGDASEGGIQAGCEPGQTGVPGLLGVAADGPVGFSSYLQGPL